MVFFELLTALATSVVLVAADIAFEELARTMGATAAPGQGSKARGVDAGVMRLRLSISATILVLELHLLGAGGGLQSSNSPCRSEM